MQALHRLLLPSLLVAGGGLAAVEGPRVNEIIANSDGAVVDSIELANPTAAPIDLGGWWLSDDVDALQTYRIPDGTTIPAGGYLVLLEDDDSDPDNNAELPPQYFGNHFSLSSRGEEVWLSAPDQVYRHGFAFGPSDINVSLGPVSLSTGAETVMVLQSVTLGAANAEPAVGPVVISEIMYHPADGGVEFVELLNIGAGTVALADTVNGNGWELDGAQFFFPLDAELPPGRTALVVEGEPADFRSAYGVAEQVAIYGPMPGGLKNSGERLSLRRPLPPELVDGISTVTWVDVDSVAYGDEAPWPSLADGAGPSLRRVVLDGIGDEVRHWRAGPVGGDPGLVDPRRAIGLTWEVGGEALPAMLTVEQAERSWQAEGLAPRVFGLDPEQASRATVAPALSGDG